MGECRFYLGVHEPSWLRTAGVPLFVSRRRLIRLKTLPRAAAPWALDSGGFTELQLHGEWRLTARDYVALVRRYVDEIGRVEWAAPQDWMCEPIVIKGGRAGRIAFAGTGLSVEEHQRRTVANLLELRTLAPELPWAPVLQGWHPDDYLRCWAQYDAAGIDLCAEPVVGVGSVCRRQHSDEAVRIFRSLQPLRLHGFGLKLAGLKRATGLLSSADSMAWSDGARHAAGKLCDTRHARGAQKCANCLPYAMMWRQEVVSMMQSTRIEGRRQADLFIR